MSAPASSTSAVPAAAAQIHQLNFARRATVRLLEDIPVEQRCAQPGPCVNHAMWVVGHLATTDDYMIKECGGSESLALPEAWHTIFGLGSQPISDPAQYPPFDEVRSAFDERHESLLRWFESLDEARLREPMPENWKAYAPTLGEFAHFLAWHEGYHAGQLAVLRKGLGLPMAFK